jgi:cell wall-associated NlpC family hydrolase
MPNLRKAVVVVLLCGMGLCPSRAQQTAGMTNAASKASIRSHNASVRALGSEERLTVIASALELKTPRAAESDCSHLVHAIYERAGFPYTYASSRDLYDGVENFQRVSQPQPADLVVWRGHVGIVTRPSEHRFYSFLSAGPATDDYRNQYWKSRGKPRFYRYIKN